MHDPSKPYHELLEENVSLKQRIQELEASIEEIKQAQEALKITADTYRSIFMNAPVGFFRTDIATGLLLDANDAIAQIIGYKNRSELLSQPYKVGESYVDPQAREQIIASFKEKGEIRGFEVQFRRSDGSTVWHRLSAKIIPEKGWIEGVAEVITDHKQSEENLRESERKYHELYDFLPIPIYEMDLEANIISANHAVYDTFRGTEADLKKGFKVWQILLPEDVDKVYEKMQQLLKGAKTGGAEYTLKRLDGSCFPAIIISSAIYRNGKPVGLRGVVIDITERRHQEEELRRLTAFMDSILENIPDMIFVKDAGELRFIRFNRAGEELLGYSRDDLLGKSDYDFFPKEQAEFFTGKDRAVLCGKEILDIPEESIQTRDKGERILHTKKVPILDANGEPEYLLGISEDITERHQAEEALRKSEERYRNIIENIVDVYYRTDREGRLIMVSPSGVTLFGYDSDDEFIGKGIAETFYYDPEEMEKILSALQEKESVQDLEVTLRHKNGKPIPMTVSSRYYYDENGAVLGAEGILRDVRDRKRAEEEKRSLEEQLQRAEKMEALGALAGGVAHDLNNVLGIVVGYAELLLSRVEESSAIRPGLVNIMEGGQRAAAIVQDLLTLARRGVAGRKVLNLNKIIAECLKSPEFDQLSSYHPSVKIKADLEPDLLNVSGSSVHLGKTLFNLVSNASEAMQKSGVVTIKTANQYLDKPVQGYEEAREGDHVVLSVSDTGEGISASDLKRIFEPFYTKKVMGRSGTGLGLAVVWGTVKDHQGYINVESVEGRGSTFTLYFPVTREDLSSEAVAVSISAYMGKGESILVVDDVKGQRDLAAGILGKLNYSVTSVSSGEEAIAYLKDHHVDLMVLDMIMDPGMDGLDTYRGVLEIHPKQKAIIVSGFSETHRVDAAHALGAGAYVRKPYIMEKLGLAVRKELDRI